MSHSARIVRNKPDYLILDFPTGVRGIYCTHCTWVSYSQGDIENRYCGHCHKFHEDRQLEARLRAAKNR